MIIDCPTCRSRVDAEVHGERKSYNPQEDPFPYKVALLSCPSCGSTLVGLSEQIHDHPDNEPYWEDALRLWPEPKRVLPPYIPDFVRNSLEEADRCFNAGAYAACAVMCGRALEGICLHFKTKSTVLHTALIELRDTEIIDKRIYTWGDELRKVRNLGAHATAERVPPTDARYVLDFVHAITEYVFVLNKKFDDFMRCRAK
jgi:hypothetical protein